MPAVIQNTSQNIQAYYKCACCRGELEGRCGRIYRRGRRPPRPRLFFAEIGHLTLCGCLGKKNAPNCVNLLWKLQTPLIPPGAKVLSVLNLGIPSLKKTWICPCVVWFRCPENRIYKEHFRTPMVCYRTRTPQKTSLHQKKISRTYSNRCGQIVLSNFSDRP